MKYNESLSKNLISNNYVIYIIILIIPLYGLNYEYSDFQDSSVAWEGVYRLFNNQKPFEDFGMPFGTGVFILPTIISKIFGFSMKSLYLSSYVLNVIYLLFFYKFLKTFKFNYCQILISLFFISLSIISAMPWYNSTAFIYSFLSIYFFYNFLIIDQKYFKILLSSIFCSLSIFSKQDYGLLCLIFIFINLIFNLKKVALRNIVIILLTYLICVLLPFFYYLKSEIWYWFNFVITQKHGQVSVFSVDRTILRHLNFSVFLVAYIFVFGYILYQFKKFDFINFKKNEDFFNFFLIFIFFQNIVCGYLSGSGPTANSEFVNIIIPLIFIYNYKNFKKIRYKIKVYIIFLFLLVSTYIFIKPGKLDSFVLVNKFKNLEKFSILGNLRELRNFVRKNNDLQFFNFKNYETTNLMQLLNYQPKQGFECNFITVGELVILYKHLNSLPCTKHPLYYTYGTAFFDRDLLLMKERIINNYYGSFLYQDLWDEGSNIAIKKELDKYYNLKLIIKNLSSEKYNLYLYESKIN
jgi:hypothetical protein